MPQVRHRLGRAQLWPWSVVKNWNLIKRIVAPSIAILNTLVTVKVKIQIYLTIGRTWSNKLSKYDDIYLFLESPNISSKDAATDDLSDKKYLVLNAQKHSKNDNLENLKTLSFDIEHEDIRLPYTKSSHEVFPSSVNENTSDTLEKLAQELSFNVSIFA